MFGAFAAEGAKRLNIFMPAVRRKAWGENTTLIHYQCTLVDAYGTPGKAVLEQPKKGISAGKIRIQCVTKHCIEFSFT